MAIITIHEDHARIGKAESADGPCAVERVSSVAVMVKRPSFGKPPTVRRKAARDSSIGCQIINPEWCVSGTVVVMDFGLAARRTTPE